jgi:hypothetical protein
MVRSNAMQMALALVTQWVLVTQWLLVPQWVLELLSELRPAHQQFLGWEPKGLRQVSVAR